MASNLGTCNRVILKFNPSFGRELVVQHTKLSMFSKFAVDAWSRCGGLNKRNILYWLVGGKTHFGMPEVLQ